MKYRSVAIVVIIFLVLAGIYSYISHQNAGEGTIACPADARLCPDGSSVGRVPPGCDFAACPEATSSAPDPKNATYLIEGSSVQLVDGKAESDAAPGSASKTITTYFGNDASGDLNGDGKDDIAFILTQSRGGSGTYFYGAALMSSGEGFVGSNAVYLGDRIAPQATTIQNGKVTFNYADRTGGEPMTAQPSVGMSKTFVLEEGALVPVTAKQ